MSKAKELLNSITPINVNGEEFYQIDNFPDAPTTDDKIDFLYLLMEIQSLILNQQQIYFPIKMDIFHIDIPSREISDSNTIKVINKIYQSVESVKEKLITGKSFLKFQLLFDKNTLLPNIRIHFYVFHKNGEISLRYESSLYQYTFFAYEDEIFNPKRKEAMNKVSIPFQVIEVLPNINLCPIIYDLDGNLHLPELENYTKTWA